MRAKIFIGEAPDEKFNNWIIEHETNHTYLRILDLEFNNGNICVFYTEDENFE